MALNEGEKILEWKMRYFFKENEIAMKYFQRENALLCDFRWCIQYMTPWRDYSNSTKYFNSPKERYPGGESQWRFL